MIYSDQDGFKPQIIAQVCVCVAPQQRSGNTSACSSLMCCCYDKGQNSVQREQTCNVFFFFFFFGGFNGKNTVTSVVVRFAVKLAMLMWHKT